MAFSTLHELISQLISLLRHQPSYSFISDYGGTDLLLLSFQLHAKSPTGKARPSASNVEKSALVSFSERPVHCYCHRLLGIYPTLPRTIQLLASSSHDASTPQTNTLLP